MAYGYKRQINLTGQTGAGTNYQVKLLVGESSGSGTNNFHLNGNAQIFPSAKNQGGDLKFYANDETTSLDFWVETVTGSGPNRVATIWVEVQADLGSNQSIWIYYGDAGASNLSNGANTFTLFDDFDSGSINTSLWTTPAGYSISSSILTINAGNDYKLVTSSSAYGDNLEVMTRMSPGGTDASTSDIIGFTTPDGFYFFANIYPSFSGNQSFARLNGSWIGLSTRYQNSYYKFQVSRGGGSGKIIIDGTTKYTGASVSSTASIIQIGRSYEYSYTIDWVAVKKWQATEPSFSTAGSETTTATNITVNATVVSATFSIPAYTTTAIRNITVSGTVQSATFSIPAYSQVSSVSVSPSAQSATFSIPVYDAFANDVVISPSAQVATFSIPSYVADAVRTVTVDATVQSATFSIPTYSITTSTSVSASVASATFSIPLYATDGTQSVSVSASTQALTFTIPAYQADAIRSTSIAPSVQALTFTIPSYTVAVIANETVLASVVTATFAIPSFTLTADFWQNKYPTSASSPWSNKY